MYVQGKEYFVHIYSYYMNLFKCIFNEVENKFIYAFIALEFKHVDTWMATDKSLIITCLFY
jgi:hypothetical protein